MPVCREYNAWEFKVCLCRDGFQSCVHCINFITHMTEECKINFINCALSSIKAVAPSRKATVLNLHHNKLSEISDLDGFPNIKHLDLSSNVITKISGLNFLSQIRTVNLSSNSITKIEGLRTLK